MRSRLNFRRCTLVLLGLLLPARAVAMNLPYYPLDSLVYLSTDIVVADLSKDACGNFTANVTEALFGSLQPGTKLDTLTPFLTFFEPLNDGQRVILFLDRRPHQYDFLHQDAAKSPFAVPPSGVYLIDGYGHVHEFVQQMNPGPYVAQGYMFFPQHRVPTEKADLDLPPVDDVKARISAAVKSVIPIRNFLDHNATAANLPALMKLLVARPRIPETCEVGMNDAIAAAIVEKIRSLNDPELLLEIWHLYGAVVSAPAFVQDENSIVDANNGFTATRVNFLIQTLADRKKDVSLRIASLQILLELSAFHSGPQSGPSRPLPIDNNWLASSAGRIVATAKAIFNDPAEYDELRALSLPFLDLDNRDNVEDIRLVYGQTRSPELQFAIERAFLQVSDELYQSLHSQSGPVASLVQLAPEHGCVQPPSNQIVFLARFYSTRAFNREGAAVAAGHVVLRNSQTRQRFELRNHQNLELMGGYYSIFDGVLIFALDQLSNVPAGTYTLGMEYQHDSKKVQSVGHPITVSIIDSHDGKHLSIPPSDNLKKLWGAAVNVRR